MGRSEMDGRCKRHPKHRQSKGVCPFCLRERLSHISATSSTTTTNASSTSSYSSDSNLSSSTKSPPRQGTRSTRFSLLLKGNPGKSEPLRKSRSLASVMRDNKEEDRERQKEEGRKEKDEKKKKKKRRRTRKKEGSFWSKLMIGSDRRKREVNGSLSHSKTMKEKSSAKWALF